MKRALVLVMVIGSLTLGLTACINLPGDTSQIKLLSTSTSNGLTYQYYENDAYPCAISGFQTFAIAYHPGTPSDAPHPLWVYLHGGGSGYWDTSTNPPTFQPDTQFTSEESLAELQSKAPDAGLLADVASDPAGFRELLVSYCDRDVYGGTGAADPGNPHTYDGGQPRTTNGLVATKAAIQYTEANFDTTTYILHGTSAGSYGAYAVAWGLQQQGIPPVGVVADSGVQNAEWRQAVISQNLTCPLGQLSDSNGVSGRVDPTLANAANEPDKLVTSGQLTVPIAQVWDHADPTMCGDVPMQCPVRNLPPGSPTAQEMASADCENQPMHQAILNEGPESTSISIEVCVNPTCNKHVVTKSNDTSSLQPADYNAAIWSWVQARLAAPAAAPAGTARTGAAPS